MITTLKQSTEWIPTTFAISTNGGFSLLSQALTPAPMRDDALWKYLTKPKRFSTLN